MISRREGGREKQGGLKAVQYPGGLKQSAGDSQENADTDEGKEKQSASSAKGIKKIPQQKQIVESENGGMNHSSMG